MTVKAGDNPALTDALGSLKVKMATDEYYDKMKEALSSETAKET